jgi:hypothetical protein
MISPSVFLVDTAGRRTIRSHEATRVALKEQSRYLIGMNPQTGES